MADGPAGRFQKGHKRLGGRARGTSNKLSPSLAAVVDEIAAEPETARAIRQWRDSGDPALVAACVKLLACRLPRIVHAELDGVLLEIDRRGQPPRVIEAQAQPVEPALAPPAGDGAVGHEPPPPAASSSAPRRSLELEVDESLARENDRALRSARAGRPDLFDRTSWERREPPQGRADL